MNMSTIIIFSVMCIGCFFYYKFTMQKAKAVIDDFDEQAVKDNLGKHMLEVLNTNLSKLKNWMGDKPIDSFVDASIAVSLKDKTKNAAIDAAKSVAWRAVGVKASYSRVDTPTFLVLSNDDLHFVSSDVDGDLNTHLTFNKEQLSKAKIVYKGPKKGPSLASGVSDMLSEKLNKEEAIVNVFEITLDVDGMPFSIQSHDKTILPYETAGRDYTKNSLIANLIANDFYEKLAVKYPNLKASKIIQTV